MRKTLPVLLASAAVALPLALVAHANAAQPQPAPPQGGIVLYDAFGTPVAVLQPIAAPQEARQAAVADPALGMIRRIEAMMGADGPAPFLPNAFFAQQDAMMRQVMQRLDSLASAPAPSPGMIEAALGAAPGTASQVMVSAFSAGNGSCSETVSYAYPGNGAAPEVSVHRTGNACGAMNLPQMQGLPAAQPVAPQPLAPSPEQITPRPAGPGGAHLIRVDYRHPARPATRLRG